MVRARERAREGLISLLFADVLVSKLLLYHRQLTNLFSLQKCAWKVTVNVACGREKRGECGDRLDSAQGHVVCRVEEEGGGRGASVLHYTVVQVCMVCVTKYMYVFLSL